jgi:hypothetical protein
VLSSENKTKKDRLRAVLRTMRCHWDYSFFVLLFGEGVQGIVRFDATRIATKVSVHSRASERDFIRPEAFWDCPLVVSSAGSFARHLSASSGWFRVLQRSIRRFKDS